MGFYQSELVQGPIDVINCYNVYRGIVGRGGGHVLNNDCAFQNDASYEIGMHLKFLLLFHSQETEFLFCTCRFLQSCLCVLIVRLQGSFILSGV